MTQSRTRKNDPEKIEMTPTEFADVVRNGGNGKARFDWQGWIKVLFVILLPGVALVSYITSIDGTVTKVKENVERHEAWIEGHTQDTANLKDSIHQLDSKQGVILEKITRAQQDIEQLLRESRME